MADHYVGSAVSYRFGRRLRLRSYGVAAGKDNGPEACSGMGGTQCRGKGDPLLANWPSRPPSTIIRKHLMDHRRDQFGLDNGLHRYFISIPIGVIFNVSPVPPYPATGYREQTEAKPPHPRSCTHFILGIISTRDSCIFRAYELDPIDVLRDYLSTMSICLPSKNYGGHPASCRRIHPSFHRTALTADPGGMRKIASREHTARFQSANLAHSASWTDHCR